MLWHIIQYGNILAGPQLSVSNPALSGLSSAPTSSTVAASATASTTASSTPQSPTFSIKIASAKKKSEYAVQTLHLNGRFLSLDALKQGVLSKCEDRISMESGFGYIEPGHGVNGKKRWLMSDDDVQEMYSIHDDKKEILLWSYAADTTKRPHSPDNSEESSSVPKRSKYDKQVDKLREVDEIEDKIRSKNEGKYTEEQIRMWAHLIHMKKHTSYDEPPNKRFWKPKSSGTGATGATTSGATEAATSGASGVAAFKNVSASPGKRVNLRGQCIDQLLRLQQLFDSGGLTQEQYTEMKEGIMNEMKMFD